MTLKDLQTAGWLHSTDDARTVLRNHSSEKNDTPWIARFALGLGAWIAGIFLTGFLVILLQDQIRDGIAPTVIGLIIIASSITLMRIQKGIFTDQFSLSWNLAGTVLFLIGIHALFDKGNHSDRLFVCLIGVTLLCPFVYWLCQNSVQRFLSLLWIWVFTLIVASERESALLYCAGFLLALVLLVLGLGGWKSGALMRPATMGGLTGVFLFLAAMSFQGSWIDEFFLTATSRFTQIVSPLAMLLLFCFLTRPRGLSALLQIVAFGVAVFAISAAGAPGVATALGLMTIAHARKDRWITTVSTVALGVFLIHFYYFLGVSLLSKSLWLIGIGLALLLFCFLVSRKPSSLSETPS